MKKLFTLSAILSLFLVTGCGGPAEDDKPFGETPITVIGDLQDTLLVNTPKKKIYSISTISGKRYNIVETTTNVISEAYLGQHVEIRGFIIDDRARPITVEPYAIKKVSKGKSVNTATIEEETKEVPSKATSKSTPETTSTPSAKPTTAAQPSDADFRSFTTSAFSFSFQYPKNWYFKRAPKTDGEIAGYRFSLEEDGKEIVRIALIADKDLPQNVRDAFKKDPPDSALIKGVYYQRKDENTAFKIYGDDAYAADIKEIMMRLEF